MIRKHVPERLAATPLEKLRAEDLQKLYLDKQREGLSARTVRLLHVVIHAALKQALKLGYIPRNVADAATPPRAERKEIRALSREDVGRFLEAAKGHCLFAAFHLWWVQGCAGVKFSVCGGRTLTWRPGLLP